MDETGQLLAEAYEVAVNNNVIIDAIIAKHGSLSDFLDKCADEALDMAIRKHGSQRGRAQYAVPYYDQIIKAKLQKLVPGITDDDIDAFANYSIGQESNNTSLGNNQKLDYVQSPTYWPKLCKIVLW